MIDRFFPTSTNNEVEKKEPFKPLSDKEYFDVIEKITNFLIKKSERQYYFKCFSMAKPTEIGKCVVVKKIIDPLKDDHCFVFQDRFRFMKYYSVKNLKEVYFIDESGTKKNIFVEVFGEEFAQRICEVVIY
jgi:hypothetical protein